MGLSSFLSSSLKSLRRVSHSEQHGSGSGGPRYGSHDSHDMGAHPLVGVYFSAGPISLDLTASPPHCSSARRSIGAAYRVPVRSDRDRQTPHAHGRMSGKAEIQSPGVVPGPADARTMRILRECVYLTLYAIAELGSQKGRRPAPSVAGSPGNPARPPLPPIHEVIARLWDKFGPLLAQNKQCREQAQTLEEFMRDMRTWLSGECGPSTAEASGQLLTYWESWGCYAVPLAVVRTLKPRVSLEQQECIKNAMQQVLDMRLDDARQLDMNGRMPRIDF